MNEIGQIVIHKSFGEGKICRKEIEGKQQYIIVNFSIGEKKFVFPNAFTKYLKAKDEKFKEYVNSLLKSINDKLEREKLKKPVVNVVHFNQKKQNKRKNNETEEANIAFKCNYCDGGKNKNRVGFRGACSTTLISININEEKRVWCNQEECPCFLYYNGKKTRKELDAECKEDFYVCYESQLLREWTAYAGVYHMGEHEGEPKKIKRETYNNLCILTTREPRTQEEDRFIFAVFLVDDSFEGDEYQEGYVCAHPKYRIELSPKEAKKMLFWKYYCNTSNNIPSWNSGLFRYVEDYVSAQILRDISRLKKGTKEESLSKEFYEYYCKIHNIDSANVGRVKGALCKR